MVFGGFFVWFLNCSLLTCGTCGLYWLVVVIRFSNNCPLFRKLFSPYAQQSTLWKLAQIPQDFPVFLFLGVIISLLQHEWKQLGAISLGFSRVRTKPPICSLRLFVKVYHNELPWGVSLTQEGVWGSWGLKLWAFLERLWPPCLTASRGIYSTVSL